MKKYLILLSISFAVAGVYSQDYNISFTGTGAALTVDSVQVKNLKKGTLLSLNGTDVLHLYKYVGIQNLNPVQVYATVYPSPMHEQVELSFYANEAGIAQITIYDISGKEVASTKSNLCIGLQNFEIKGLKEGSYVVKVIGGLYQYTVKLSSSYNTQNHPVISYIGNVKPLDKSLFQKNTRSTIDMAYTTGDSMRYTGYSGIFQSIIKDVPTSSKTITFTFTAKLPILTTIAITGITDTTAISGGNITTDGGASVTARGVCWGTTLNPVVTGNHTADGPGTGVFTSNITGLVDGTLYYVRAYATNSTGTAYGNQLSFTTLGKPTVTTIAITGITDTTAISGGNITTDGGASVTARGVCWGTTLNPVVTGSHTTDGLGTGVFTSNITGLLDGTLYYVRAYATNIVGTSYGSQVSFTTLGKPTVTTTTITGKTDSSAKSGGNVISDGGYPVTARGVCWSTSAYPDTIGKHTTDGTGTGIFTSKISGLNAKTLYYVRAYAINCKGITFGNQISFTTPDTGFTCGTSTFQDIDGNSYNTVEIGTQCWMQQNLKTKRYNNGTVIPHITDNTAWKNLVTGAYCYYNNDSNTYKDTYGSLYNWFTVNTGILCPDGWHVPSDGEWSTLEGALGGNGVAGGKLKETGTTHWNSPNTGATNSSGFSGLPGGARDNNGTFGSIGNGGTWWSATMSGPLGAWYRTLMYHRSDSYRDDGNSKYGYSVRCLKD